MAEPHARALQGRRLIILEDEYLVAASLGLALESRGAEVVGMVGSVADGLDLVGAEGHKLDGAVLDINLHDQRVYPVADALAARGVPFVFLTGYDAHAIPDAYAEVPRCEKPVSLPLLTRLLARIWVRRTANRLG